MRRHIPNALTFSRLVMAVAIFGLLALCDLSSPSATFILDAALTIFLVAGLTDILDGYLARRLNSPTALGRISDPFIDKVLVCGVFAYFAGENFFARGDDGSLRTVTGVAMWMAVLILARELLVTGIRGFSESRGEPFPTTVIGKAKMFLQSLTIAWILLLVAHGRAWGRWSEVWRDVLVWLTVVFTAASALVYLDRTRRLMGLPVAAGQERAADE